MLCQSVFPLLDAPVQQVFYQHIMMKPYLSGLKFGMLLQIAIGPLCLLVFYTAQNTGFAVALFLVAAVALADAFYIALAALGAGRLCRHPKAQKPLRILSAVVLLAFGANIILQVFGISLIPAFTLHLNAANAFWQGVVLTLSNPLTILFWGSVLTARLAENKLAGNALLLFSVGAVCATLFFLTAVAALGTLLSAFVPDMLSAILNVVVGAVIIGFGLRTLLQKPAPCDDAA